MRNGTNKRKAAGLDEVDFLEELTKISTQLNDYIKKSDERFEQLEKQLTSRMNMATSTGNYEEDEISSDDDEESKVDKASPWEIKFQQLRDYRIIHGDCMVRFKENPQLGKWVKNQRQLYTNVKKGRKPGISPERIIKLDSIGFNWGKKFPPPPSWNEMFNQLKIFQQKMGNCNVPFNRTHPNALAKWTAYQRAEYKRFRKGLDSLLSLDQIEKLQEIGFNWKGPKL